MRIYASKEAYQNDQSVFRKQRTLLTAVVSYDSYLEVHICSGR